MAATETSLKESVRRCKKLVDSYEKYSAKRLGISEKLRLRRVSFWNTRLELAKEALQVFLRYENA